MIRRLVENECLRVASIFGADMLNERVLVIDKQFEDEMGNVYECLGRKINITYTDTPEGKPAKLVGRKK